MSSEKKPAGSDSSAPESETKPTSFGQRFSRWPHDAQMSFLVAVVSLVVSLLIAALSLFQAQLAGESQDTAQATQFALLHEENEISKAIGTTIARAIPPGPTASAVAALIAPLEETRVALEAQRQTPAPPPSPATSANNPTSVPTDIPVTVIPIQGISGKITSVSRRANTLTIQVELQNNGTEPQPPGNLLFASELYDEGSLTSYRYIRHSATAQTLQPGESTPGSLQFEVPANENPTVLTFRLRNGTMFQHIPIPTAQPQ